MKPVLCILLLILILGCGAMGAVEGAKSTCDEACAYQNYSHIVYVNSSAAASKDCVLKDHQNITSRDINTALAEQSHRNSTVFVLASGPNVTHFLERGNHSFLKELSDVGFFSKNSSNLAHVECKDGAGLAFWNVDRIRWCSHPVVL